jgi:hypothetical protein
MLPPPVDWTWFPELTRLVWPHTATGPAVIQPVVPFAFVMQRFPVTYSGAPKLFVMFWSQPPDRDFAE